MTINPTVAEPGGCPRIRGSAAGRFRCCIVQLKSALPFWRQWPKSSTQQKSPAPVRRLGGATFFSDERLRTANCHTPAPRGLPDELPKIYLDPETASPSAC